MDDGDQQRRAVAVAEVAMQAARVDDLAEASGTLGGPQVDSAFAWREGLDGMRSTVAELHAHRALAAADPTAEHVGGNRPYRDHQLFDNTAWVNTKCAWRHSDIVLGFSPVAWSVVRDRARPFIQLDLVALVPIHSDQLTFRDTGRNRIEIAWECERFWLVPASVLQANSRPDGRSRARSLVELNVLAPFAVADDNPLSGERLRQLVAQNDLAV